MLGANKIKQAILLFACAGLTIIPAQAEGPAAGPSSQGGEKSDVAPTGVEKTLPPTRITPDPSEGKVPSNITPTELESKTKETKPK
jgi:hypothetical protein